MIGRVIGSLVFMVVLSACQKAINTAADSTLTSLAGTEWGPVENEIDQFIAFKSDGEIVGSGGCNNFFGNYTQTGRRITVGPLASTRKACPEPIMTAEQDFLRLLDRVRAADATLKELTLYGADDQVLATLRRRDWD
jgi:heat shock protein HslJ